MLCRWVVLRWAQEGKGRTSDLAVRGGLLACWRWSNRWEGRSCQRWHQITTGDIHSQARNVYRNATVSVSLGACVAEIGMWLDNPFIHPANQTCSSTAEVSFVFHLAKYVHICHAYFLIRPGDSLITTTSLLSSLHQRLHMPRPGWELPG